MFILALALIKFYIINNKINFMNIFLVYLNFPDTNGCLKNALKFKRKKVFSQTQYKLKSGFIYFDNIILDFLHSNYILGILDKERIQYWKLFLRTHIRNPNMLIQSITLAIYGYHFKLICERHIK